MERSHQHWLDQQAIERLAQHIPFEVDPQTKAECIEMLRGLVLRSGREIDRSLFGFEASQELRRLGLWEKLGGRDP
jgi:gamma-glutamyl-gamma-aminobutyrate hydrolase PuuD